MQYYHLSIYTDDSLENYNSISNLLGLIPLPTVNNDRIKNLYGVWTYSVENNDESPYYDFINNFLDILESKFVALENIGITKDNITFWLLYEYDNQCGLEFDAQKLKRLGDSGIGLCIDCWQKNSILEL